jgi:hypothetical protein
MFHSNGDYCAQRARERIAIFQAEALQDAQVQAVKRQRRAAKLANWTARQRLGYLLMRWGYRLARENQPL